MSSTQTRRRGRPGGSQGSELLAVARTTFLELGFAGTTMDTVAARARISKASLYREHASKDALFEAVVLDWAAQGRDAMRPHLQRLLAAADLRDGLLTLATTIQAAVLDPDVLRMRRLVAAEAARFPDVADRYIESSWNRNISALGDALAELHTRGSLHVDDPQLAAHQLTWLSVGGPLNQQTLRGQDDAPERAQLDAIAAAAADTFLARYASGGGTSTRRRRR